MPSDYDRIRNDNIEEYGKGTRHLSFLKRLYSDKTHFIFEILQNAEDARAKRIRFDLYEDRLEVRHDGHPFSEADVRGICGVGEGTKSEDLTQIGKFGIGFKSVYAYTTSPEIHSNGGPNGSEHFRIEHYVRPIGIEPRRLKKPWTTLIILPINAEDIDQQTAVRQIADRLQCLNVRTLLFLKHIEEVEYKLFDGSQGTYRKTSDSQREVTVSGQRQISGEPHDYEEEQWLLFQRPLQMPDSTDTVNVEIGFLVKQDQKSGKRQIVRVKSSPLVVFFPTEKETHLGFLIQGPYRTTPARDNIPRDDDWNKRLVKTTGDLVCEALSQLKAQGLLTPTVLETLPIDPDHFSEDSMFYPLFEKVKEALSEHELLPAHGGGYVSASRAKLARGRGLRELLTSEQLTDLLKSKEPLQWVSGEITQDHTPHLWRYLKDEMDVDIIDPDRFARLLKPDFLQQQNDEWFTRFYGFLLGQEALWRAPRWHWNEPGILRRKAFLRLENGSLVEPFDPEGRPNAYLPPKQPTKFAVVRRTIVKDKKALEFLKRLGLEEPDEIANVIENILPKYRGEGVDQIDDREYESDLQAILHALSTDSEKKKEHLLSELQRTPFVRATNAASGDTRLRRPIEVYLPTKDLLVYFADNEQAWILSKSSLQTLQETFIDEAWKIWVDLGVSDIPRRIRHSRTPDNVQQEYSTRGTTTENYDLHGLETFLDRVESLNENSQRINLGKALWRLLVKCIEKQHNFMKGYYHWFYYYDRSKEFYADFVKILRNRAWLPTRDGICRKPVDVHLDELHPDLDRNEVLIHALGIGPDREETLRVARSIGLDEEDLKLAELRRQHPEEFRDLIYRLEARRTLDTSFPIKDVKNADRRRQKVRERVREAPPKQYDLKEQRVRTSRDPNKKDVDAYLRSMYTNEDGIMFCQICKKEMPFKKRNGQYYFERVEAFDIPIEDEANYLALCPVCAAMYKEFIRNDSEAWNNLKDAINKTNNLEIDLRLGDIDTSIRFVEPHLFELSTVLKEIGDRDKNLLKGGDS